MTSAEIPALASADATTRPPLPLRIGGWIEDGIVVIALAAMIILPLAEMVLRVLRERYQVPWTITGQSEFVKHGTLVVGVIGGAIAARRNRLLSMATSAMLPAGWPRRVAGLVSGSVAGVVSIFLCMASVWFVLDMRGSDDVIAYGIPRWAGQIVLPIGFGLIAVQILWHAGNTWRGRIAAMVLALAAVVFCIVTHPQFADWIERTSWPAIDPQKLVWPAMAILLAATVLGAPIFVLIGGAALILLWGDQVPIASMPINHYSLVTNPTLPTIPLFTLAGYFLAEGGASTRLVRVFDAMFGNLRGGPAIVVVLVCAFFTSFTGASGVTILALGGLLMPILLSANYSDRAALGLVTGAGSLGMLFPPCLPLVLYAIVAEQAMENIFLAAIVPGCVLVILTGVYGVWVGPPRPRTTGSQFRASEAIRALWQAKWELLLPLVVLYALFGGFATPVEASAITALYAGITQTIIWRDLRIFRDVPRVLVECGLVVGGVLLILGVARGLTDYLILAEIPGKSVEWVTASVKSPLMFLLLLNVFLLIVGCLMDVYSAIVVVVPLLVPIAHKFNIDPLHLGVIFLANLELGYLTPPVGLNLFLSSYRFGKPVSQVARSIVPILIIQLIGVLVITYVPPITTLLPQLLGK